MAETGASISYAELDAFANRLARFYRSLGLNIGDHVAYCLENRLECMAVQWRAHYAGLYYTFISTRLIQNEVAYIVDDCDAKVVIVTAKTPPAIIEALRALPKRPRIFSLDSSGDIESLPEAIKSSSAEPLEDPMEGSEMLYSSGTTGRPKGVKPALSGKPLGSTALIADLLTRGFGAGTDTVYLHLAPYYHGAQLKWSQSITAIGATVIMLEKFDAEGALRAIDRYQVTHSQ